MGQDLQVGDRVIVEANALNAKLPSNMTAKQRREALCDKYYVTGKGPTCVGIRNDDNTLRFNVPKSDATKVSPGT